MQKLKVLIAGNALDSVRLVEVVVTVPVEVLMPALIETMQLPRTDLFGKDINYALRFAKDGRAIAPDSTLAEAGVTLGARLILDSYVNEGVAIPPSSIRWQFEQYDQGGEQFAPGADPFAESGERFMPGADPFAESGERFMPGADPFAESGERFMPGAEQFAPGGEQFMPYREPLSPDGNADLYSGATMARAQFSGAQYPQDIQMGGVAQGLIGRRGPGITQKRKPGRSRRAFLVTAGVILGVGVVGLGYVAITGGLKNMAANEPRAAMPHPSVVPKTQNPGPPSAPKLPTSAKLRLTFTQHKNLVRLASWSPDGKLLASGADDKHAFVWGIDGAVRLDIQHPGGVRSLAWSPDGQRLVTGANNQVTFFNAQTGAILATSAQQHTQTVTSIAWVARNQMQVVSGGADKQVVVWDTKTYHAVTTYKQHNASIDMVSCSMNGQTVASSADDGFVRIWNVANGTDIHGYYQDVARPLRGMAFAPDGVQLAVGGDDGMVRIWSALTCKNDGLRCTDVPQRLHAAQTPVRAVAWSPDGRLLAVGGNDGMFSIWSPMQTQQALFSVKQNDIVRSLAWSPDGKQLVCASGNNVSIWDLI